jgi:hypothetical protein
MLIDPIVKIAKEKKGSKSNLRHFTKKKPPTGGLRLQS